MKILDAEIEFCFNDADDLERLENAIEKTNDKLSSIKTEGRKTSEIIRESCKAIFDCFNIAFGEGTDKKVFGNKTNFNICMKAFQDLYEAKIEQEKTFEKNIIEMENKYNPNRAIRRSKK